MQTSVQCRTISRWVGLLLVCLTALTARPQSYSVLHNFTGADGAYPEARLVLTGDMLYGTTCGGGISNAGTVFRIKLDGTGFELLHQFSSFGDGANPQAGLALSGSTLYGTTSGGGVSNYLCVAPSGKEGAACGGGRVEGGGTLFKIHTDGSAFAVLHRFVGPDLSSGLADGLSPQAGLLLAGSVIYGTTFQGGQALCPGVLFKLHDDGSGFAVIKSGSGPWFPDGGLVLSGSTLYGTSCSGGTLTPTITYAGMVFRVSTNGSDFSMLKAFSGGSDGAAPYGDLLLAGTTLYGTTSGDGQGNVGNGTIFKINVDGSGYAVLKTFSGSDGSSPRAGLVLVGDILCGTTSRGGSFGLGTVFKININGGDFSVLKSFAGGADGANPFGELVVAGPDLYGTTSAGGAFSNGLVFRISLAPALLAPLLTQTAEIGSSVTFKAQAAGARPLTYLWYFQSTNLLATGPDSLLQLTNVESLQAGAYSVMVTNAFGSCTSAPAQLGIIAAVPRRTVIALSLSGAPGSVLNLDTTTGLPPTGSWSTFDQVLIHNSPQWYFDLSAPSAQRFYRASQPGALNSPVLACDSLVALTLSGTAGNNVRVDYINQSGPIDAWVTLATVTLTNTSQLYIDTSGIGQPARLWRLVPLP
ncbi:MAG TPA: choice-of-anchor tandem repeat GloVer-containing protein [Verrucomicrobiae bacterium]